MKRYIAFIALIFCLSACSNKALTGADLVREKYKSIEACKLSADITADFGERIGEYSITYELKGEEGIITIEKPVEIAGITATINADGSSLSYDGLILETGKLAGTALTPIDAVPTMLNTWAAGYMTDAGTEKLKGVKCYHLTYRSTIEETEVEQHAWFDMETLKPLRAETLVDGRRVISCEFTSAEC